MGKPEISIITIVYNGLPFLKECVESVLMQDFDEWELLISDDGSNDGSREYLDSLSDPRITIFKQEKNLGIFDNLNFLFSKASAPISKILCQDDYFIGNHALRTIYDYWLSAPSTTGFARFNHAIKNPSSLVAFQVAYLPETIKTEDAALYFFIFGNIPGNLSNISLRTSLVQNNGGFRQQLPYAGDFDFWSRAAMRCDMGIQSAQVTYIRRHPGTASNYLNKQGELLSQVAQVISSIYSIVVMKYPQSRTILRIHGTLNYDTLHRDRAFKKMLRGDSRYVQKLNTVSDNAPYSLKAIPRWGLFLLTGAGRMGRVIIAKRVLRSAGKK